MQAERFKNWSKFCPPNSATLLPSDLLTLTGSVLSKEVWFSGGEVFKISPLSAADSTAVLYSRWFLFLCSILFDFSDSNGPGDSSEVKEQLVRTSHKEWSFDSIVVSVVSLHLIWFGFHGLHFNSFYLIPFSSMSSVRVFISIVCISKEECHLNFKRQVKCIKIHWKLPKHTFIQKNSNTCTIHCVLFLIGPTSYVPFILLVFESHSILCCFNKVLQPVFKFLKLCNITLILPTVFVKSTRVININMILHTVFTMLWIQKMFGRLIPYLVSVSLGKTLRSKEGKLIITLFPGK